MVLEPADVASIGNVDRALALPAQALARMVRPTNAFPSDQIAPGTRSLSAITESNALTIHSQSALDITSEGKSFIV